MYVLMLVNNWSTKDNIVNIVNQSNNGFIPDFIPGSNSEELLDSPNLFVGHDWSTVWVKVTLFLFSFFFFFNSNDYFFRLFQVGLQF